MLRVALALLAASGLAYVLGTADWALILIQLTAIAGCVGLMQKGMMRFERNKQSRLDEEKRLRIKGRARKLAQQKMRE